METFVLVGGAAGEEREVVLVASEKMGVINQSSLLCF